MQLIAIAKAANNGIDVADTVLAIPGWYTDAMRSSMLVSKAFSEVLSCFYVQGFISWMMGRSAMEYHSGIDFLFAYFSRRRCGRLSDSS